MLAFSSCSSIGNLSDETLPGWIDNPYVRSGRIAYVNEGSGNSEEEAELNAMENLLIELGSDLGIDAYALYFRELSSSGTLNALDGNITDTYFRTYRGGRYSCYVMLDISADLFDQMQSPETRRAMEVRAEIESLMESARQRAFVFAWEKNGDFPPLPNSTSPRMAGLRARPMGEMPPSSRIP